MKNLIYSSGIALVLLLGIDFVWLSISGPTFYKKYIGHLMAAEFSYLPAIIFYVMYAIGLSYLIILPSVTAGEGFMKVLTNGAVLGLLAYGAYDLTNQATLKDWPLLVTIVDMAWGATLTAAASALSYVILQKLQLS